jgi:hypothetical protein
MRKGRGDPLLLGRQRDLGLDAVQMVALRPRALEPLAVRDAAAGGHQLTSCGRTACS